MKLLTTSLVQSPKVRKSVQHCTKCGSPKFYETTKYDEHDEKAEHPIEYYWECLVCGNKDYNYIPF